jgi:ParB family chromosome partitioning protein
MTDNIRKISEIKIGKRHRKSMGDIRAFADNIKTIGLLHPIVINKNDELIAGERRIRAYQLLDRTEIPVTVVDLNEIIRGEFSENEQRKDFTITEAVKIKRAVEPLLKAEAKERQAAGGKLKAGGKLPHAAKGKTRDKVAKYTGVKPTSLRKAEAVVAAAEAEPDNKEITGLVETMDKTGKVDRAYKVLKAAQELSPDALRAATSAMREQRLVAKEAGDQLFEGYEDVEDIVDIICVRVGESKAKEIAAGILKRYKRTEAN